MYPVAYVYPPQYPEGFYPFKDIGHIDGEIRTDATFRDPITAHRFPYDTQNYGVEVGIFPTNQSWLKYSFIHNQREFAQTDPSPKYPNARIGTNQISIDNT